MADSSVQAAHERARVVLENIVDGAIAPYQGARKLWTEFYSEDPDSFPELATFVNDATDYEELPARRTEVLQHIVDESRRILKDWFDTE